MMRYKPEESARDFLDVMDEAVKDCDMSLFSLYMANVFSNAERAFNIVRSPPPSVPTSSAMQSARSFAQFSR